jgi:hypothetical protein
MLGYEVYDQEEMVNAIHDAKLFYIRNSGVVKVDEDPIIEGLLKAQDFLQGLWSEGYFD